MVEGDRAAMGKMYRIQHMMAGYEQLKALMEFAGVPFVQVHPGKWQSKLSLRVRGVMEEKHDRKKRYQQVAGQLYPGVKVTLWNADALLIMHFGRRMLVSELDWVRDQLPRKEWEKLF